MILRANMEMYRLENLMAMLDFVTNTKRKRHILGGVLISISLLFGGLAFTVITIKNEGDEHEQLE